MTIHVGAKHQVTLPNEIFRQARLSPGDPLEVLYEDDQIILRPQAYIPRDQAYFWTKKWQEGEREADEDIKAGRVTKTKNLKALFKKLDEGRAR